MHPAYGILLDSMETAARALLGQIVKTQTMDRETVQKIGYGIQRVEAVLTTAKNMLMLNGTPAASLVTTEETKRLGDGAV